MYPLPLREEGIVATDWGGGGEFLSKLQLFVKENGGGHRHPLETLDIALAVL